MAEDRTRESQLWAWLRRGLKPFGLSAHVHRVENAVETGDPDVEGCICGVSFHIELKVAYERAAGRIEVMIEREQAYWAHCRGRAGGRSHVLVRVGKEHYLLPWTSALDLFEARKALTAGWLAERSLCASTCTAWEIWEIAST